MEILIIFGLILLNGLFALAEMALVSVRKIRLEAQANKGDRKARAALELANHPDKFISTTQIGITLIGILNGIFSGESIKGNLAAFLLTESTGMPASASCFFRSEGLLLALARGAFIMSSTL